LPVRPFSPHRGTTTTMKSSNAPATHLRVVGAEASEAFSLSEEDTAHIMGILRSSIYSDPIAAVIREYASNAWDSHKQTPGCENIPIKVTVPTALKPTLIIRDYGMGLSESDVLRVYTKYGRSKKRDTNQAVGFLGLGCKSAFAYTTQFTLTSWHGGRKRIFLASLDDTGVGVMQKMHEEPSNETGIEVQIAVQPKDCGTFREKARTILQHFEPLPEINLDLATSNRLKLRHGYMYTTANQVEWVAIMGCVPYRVDISQVPGSVFHNLRGVSGALYFDIGEVHFAASREELNYTDQTKRALVDRMSLLLEEYTTKAFQDLEDLNSSTSWFQKRLQAQFLKQKLRVPVEGDLADPVVGVTHKGVRVWRLGSNRPQGQIAVSGDLVLYLQDSQRSLKGYQLRTGYILESTAPMPYEDFRVRVEKFLEEARLTGVPLRKLSTVPWVQPSVKASVPSSSSAKYRTDTFLYNPKRETSRPSDSWEIQKKNPEASDIYVLLRSFEPTDFKFFDNMREDGKVLALLGETLPPIYGYKVTVSNHKDMTERNLPGTPYYKWRQSHILGLLQQEHKDYLTHLQWVSAFERRYARPARDYYLKASCTAKNLGEGHPLVQVWERFLKAKAFLESHEHLAPLRALQRSLPEAVPEKGLPKPVLETLRSRYPMLAMVSPSNVVLAFLDQDLDHAACIEYVKLVDSQKVERKTRLRSKKAGSQETTP
jgi:hypothetical protein